MDILLCFYVGVVCRYFVYVVEYQKNAVWDKCITRVVGVGGW